MIDGFSRADRGAPMHGLDVSEHQETIDWAEVARDCEFVWIRASYGGEDDDLDVRYREHLSGARAHGLLVGHYHFAYPTGPDAGVEADHFLEVLDRLPGEPVALDIEELGLGGWPDASPKKLTQWVMRFSKRVATATGVIPVLYTTPDMIRSRMANDPRLAGLPLWIANWEADEPDVPPLWHREFCWQFTEKGEVAGISTPVDRNRFAGGQSEWTAAGGIDEWAIIDHPVPDDARIQRWSRSVKLDATGTASLTVAVPAEMVVAVNALGANQVYKDAQGGTAITVTGEPDATVEVQVWVLRQITGPGDGPPPGPVPFVLPDGHLLADDPKIGPGDTGEAVSRWQRFLNHYTRARIGVTGVMDEATVTATKHFQSVFSLDADGVVGTGTRKAAAALISFPPAVGPSPVAPSPVTTSPGPTSPGTGGPSPVGDDATADLQALLADVMYPVGVDGVYGPQTRLALRRFQNAYALQALSITGEPNAETVAALQACRDDGGAISEHFTLDEFRCDCAAAGVGAGSAFCGGQVWIDRRVVAVAEGLRDLIGSFSPLSGCRCEAHNRRIGGSPKSQHIVGLAIDIPTVVARDAALAAVPAINGVGLRRSLVSHADARNGGFVEWNYD